MDAKDGCDRGGGLPLPPKHSQVAATTTNIPLVTPAVIASTYNVTGVVVDRSGKNRQAVAEFQVQGLRHRFGPFPTDSSAVCHPSRGVRRVLLGGHAHGVLIGACNPML